MTETGTPRAMPSLDDVPVAVVVHDMEGRVRFANLAAVEMHGYTGEEILALRVDDLDTEEDAAAIGARIEALLAEGSVRFRVHHRRKDGSVFPLDVQARMIEWERSPAVLAVAVDDTERTRAQEELEAAQSLLRAAVLQSTAGILVADAPDVSIRIANAAALGIRGAPAEDLTEIPVELHPSRWQTYHPDGTPYRPEDLPLSRAVLAGETVVNEEVIIRNAAGEDRWVMASATPVRDSRGEIVAGIVVFPDVTQLRQTEERLRLLVDESVLIMSMIDEDGRVVEWSKGAEEMSGLPRREVLGRYHWDVLHDLAPLATRSPERRAFIERRIRDALQTGVPGSRGMREVEARRVDGSRVFLEETSFPFRTARGYRFVTIAHDVTERRRAAEERGKLEAQLQQAMKMEAIGRLAGGVAHDFNNLLTGISGNLALAMMDLSPADPLHELLTDAAKAAESAAALTRQLLAFSRKQIIEPRVLDPNDLIRGVEKMLRRILGEDIELVTQVAEPVGNVRIDPGQLEQVLVNLVVNARDAMPEGGRLVIRTESVPASPSGRAQVALTVSDSGHGMDEEVKRHLFEPFFTTKPKGRGTGLGLATSYGVIQQAGGVVEIESAVGVGTTVRMVLPRAGAEAAKLEPSGTSADLPRGDETVLLVEDDERVRGLAMRLLRRLGYRVLEAANGGEALLLAEEHRGPIDLLLTDVVMPGLNGRQLAERLAGLHPEMRVLYTSGYTDDVIAQHGVLEEGLLLLAKPYTLPALARKVREAIGIKE